MFKYLSIIFLTLFCYSFGYSQYTQKRVNLESQFINCVKYNLIGRQDKAIDTLKILNEEYPDNAAILHQLSKGYALDKNWEQSLQYALQTVENEKNTTYQKHLGDIALKAEDYPIAVQSWKPLYKASPDNEEYGDKLATAYLLKGDAKQAIKTYNRLENTVGIKENIIRRKYEVYNILGDKQGMEQELIKLSNAFPDNITYLKNLAKFYKNNKQMDKAMAIYKKANGLDNPQKQPRHSVKKNMPVENAAKYPQHNLGYTDFSEWEQELLNVYNSKNYDLLEVRSFEALDNFPSQAISYWYNGYALNKLKRYSEAELILSEAVIVASGDDTTQSKIYTELAKSLIAKNNKEKAKTFIDTALSLDSNNKEAFTLLKKL